MDCNCLKKEQECVRCGVVKGAKESEIRCSTWGTTWERHYYDPSTTCFHSPKDKLKEEPEEEKCKHCNMNIAIRNPSGFCDHLHHPEYCDMCKKLKQNREYLGMGSNGEHYYKASSEKVEKPGGIVWHADMMETMQEVVKILDEHHDQLQSLKEEIQKLKEGIEEQGEKIWEQGEKIWLIQEALKKKE
jgi:hypothetical protein